MIRQILRRIQVRRTRKAITQIIEQNRDSAAIQSNAIKIHKEFLKEDLQRSATEYSPIPRHSIEKDYKIHFDKLVHSEFTKKSPSKTFFTPDSNIGAYRILLAKLNPPTSE